MHLIPFFSQRRSYPSLEKDFEEVILDRSSGLNVDGKDSQELPFQWRGERLYRAISSIDPLIGLYARRDIDFIRSPTTMKSPLETAKSAKM